MTVLVAYGTTGGGTGEIAEWVAEELRAAGLTVRLMPAAEVADVTGYDALILGSALYGYGWHLDVRRFALVAAEHVDALLHHGVDDQVEPAGVDRPHEGVGQHLVRVAAPARRNPLHHPELFQCAHAGAHRALGEPERPHQLGAGLLRRVSDQQPAHQLAERGRQAHAGQHRAHFLGEPALILHGKLSQSSKRSEHSRRRSYDSTASVGP
jgi:hypothetical protein